VMLRLALAGVTSDVAGFRLIKPSSIANLNKARKSHRKWDTMLADSPDATFFSKKSWSSSRPAVSS